MSVPAISQIYLIDDDAGSRAAIGGQIRRHGLTTTELSSPSSLPRIDTLPRPICIIYKLELAELDGLKFQSQLQERGEAPSLVFISTRASVANTVHAMRHGAISVLVKPVEPRELIGAVNDGLAADRFFARRKIRFAQTHESLMRLTKQELQVLKHVLEGIPNKNIARALNVSLRTIETRRHGIYEKMKTDNIALLVRKIVEYECAFRDPLVGHGPHFRLIATWRHEDAMNTQTQS